MQGKLGMNLSEWRKDTILDAGGNRSTRRKPARVSMDWEPNSHTTHLARLEIEPGPHWWKAREQPLRQPACPNNYSLAIFVSPELSSKRDYVITHCVRSMYVVCTKYMVCMYMCVLFCKIYHCIHIHWCIPMGLGHKDPWVASHMWPQQTWGQRSSRRPWPLVQVFENKSLYSHTLTYFHGTWIKWSFGKVTLVTSTEVGSKVILG